MDEREWLVEVTCAVPCIVRGAKHEDAKAAGRAIGASWQPAEAHEGARGNVTVRVLPMPGRSEDDA